MNKTEIINHVAEKHEYTKDAAAELINAFLDTIVEKVAAGEEVSITGFGTFKPAERSARIGRNPKTGESLEIAASRSPKFSAGAAFKKAMGAEQTEAPAEAKAA